MAKKEMKITQEDYVKIHKALARKEEMELLGPGFHSKDRAWKNAKVYSRKEKHKGSHALYFLTGFCIILKSF